MRIPVHYTLEGFQKGETKLGSSFKLTLREKENVLPELSSGHTNYSRHAYLRNVAKLEAKIVLSILLNVLAALTESKLYSTTIEKVGNILYIYI